MGDEGELKAGQANGLLRPLEERTAQPGERKQEDACNQLQDFIDEVIAKTPVPLIVLDSDALIADAEAIRSSLGCAP